MSTSAHGLREHLSIVSCARDIDLRSRSLSTPLLNEQDCQVEARLLQDALWPPAVHVIIELVAAFVIGMGIAKAFQYIALRLKRTAQGGHRADRHSAR